MEGVEALTTQTASASTFHEIAEAYAALKDEGRRDGYDHQLRQEESLYGSRSYHRSQRERQQHTNADGGVGRSATEAQQQRQKERARFAYENRRHFVNPTEEMAREKRDRRLTVWLGGGFLAVVVLQFAYLHFAR